MLLIIYNYHTEQANKEFAKLKKFFMILNVLAVLYIICSMVKQLQINCLTNEFWMRCWKLEAQLGSADEMAVRNFDWSGLIC